MGDISELGCGFGENSGEWISWGVFASLWQLSFIFLHVSAHVHLWICVLAVFHEVPLADIAAVQSLLWNNVHMCWFGTLCMKTRFIPKTPFSFATNIVSDRWNEQLLLLPHLEVEKRIEPREYAILLIDYSSVLPAERVPQSMAQMPVLGWIWALLSQKQLLRAVLTNALSWCFFLLPLSRKHYTIHKKARTSEKRGSKPATARDSSVLPAVLAAGDS